MATYYVSKLGSDSNDGSSAATAFLTIDKAANEVASGDIVYIAPGTYRELVTMDTSGGVDYSTLPEGINYIEFFGDADAKHFPSVTPGVIRVTQAAAGTEAAGTSNNYVWNFNGKARIRVHNIIADGMAGSTDTSNSSRYAWRNSATFPGVSCFNCTGIGSYASFANISALVRCFGVGGYINIAAAENLDVIGIGGIYVYRGYNGYYRNCISMGGLYGFSPSGNDKLLNCISMSYIGYLIGGAGDLIENCMTLGSYSAFWCFQSPTTSRTKNSVAIAATTGYNRQYLENCYVSNCRKADNNNNDGPGGTPEISEAAAISFSMKNFRMIYKAFIPFMARGLMNQGTYSNLTGAFGSHLDSTSTNNRGPSGDPGLPSASAPVLTDVLGRNRLNSAYGDATKSDIGPYEFTVFSGSNNPATYHATAPGINIQGRGEVVFEVAVPSGSAITASVYAKTPDSNYSPKFLIRDPKTYYLYDSLEKKRNSRNGFDVTASVIAAGTSWANNTFQQLTVHAPTTTYDRMYELVISGSAGTNVTSSFSDFNITIG